MKIISAGQTRVKLVHKGPGEYQLLGSRGRQFISLDSPAWLERHETYEYRLPEIQYDLAWHFQGYTIPAEQPAQRSWWGRLFTRKIKIPTAKVVV